ncbi:hypothetical protein [Sporosarcina trichiuri]|uniref:hypothetical protein n=1 Tax=Sporosarcina trichiuri TaxID=3056445 RepID=UPI0025B39065|nr:hypothetical protein [Sporosarcina sp. 0.2-SM1T-5]WJY27071.1 hypothetical protein QWT68_13630 [Sporosarcina sp. 0.2-SM1T-5]
MIRTLSLLLISFCLLTIYAVANDKPGSYEEAYPEIGYKTVEGALDDFEQHFKQKLKLPLRVPPISFTHQLGRFNDLDGDINDTFEVTFINDQLPENHFKIDVHPFNHKIEFSEKYVSRKFQLNNGKVAKYMEKPIPDFNLLVFERDNWQYVFSIDKKVSDIVTPEVLVQIANSIDF